MGTSPRGRKTRSSYGGGDEEEDEVDEALENILVLVLESSMYLFI